MTYHLFLIHIEFNKLKTNKDKFLKYLNNHNINAQYHYVPIYKFKVYADKKNYYKGVECYYKNTVSLPIYVDLKLKDQNKIIKIIKSFLDEKSD